MTDPSHESLRNDNLHGWNTLAPIHARGSGSPFYRIEEFVAGECKLGPWEIDILNALTTVPTCRPEERVLRAPRSRSSSRLWRYRRCWKQS